MTVYYTTMEETIRDIVCKAASSLGYQHLNEKQIEAACSILSGEDIFVAITICYSRHSLVSQLENAVLSIFLLL